MTASRSLDGRRILVLREEDEGPLASLLTEAGASLRFVPLTRTEAPEDPGPLVAAAARLHEFDWVAFTSARAVAALWDVAPAMPSATARPKWACVGPSTAAALRKRIGREPDLVPERFDAAGLWEALLAFSSDRLDVWRPTGPAVDAERAIGSASSLDAADSIDSASAEGPAGSTESSDAEDAEDAASPAGRSVTAGAEDAPRVLFPAADNARRVLPETLRAAGWRVEQVTAYRTVAVRPRIEEILPGLGAKVTDRSAWAEGAAQTDRFDETAWDAVLLTSGTAAGVLVAICTGAWGPEEARRRLQSWCPAVLGRTAEEALRRAGIEPAVRAPEPTGEALAQAVIEFFRSDA